MWKSVTPQDDPAPVVWEWATGIPQSVAKSDDIRLKVPEDAVAALVPDFRKNNIRLASAGNDAPATWSLSVVNDQRIRSMADLYRAMEQVKVTDQAETNVVEFAAAESKSEPIPTKISGRDLLALTHITAPDDRPVRIVQDGNPWVLLKDDNVMCKLMLRKERGSNLVHVVMALKVCYGDARKLPASLEVVAARQPLNCMDVSTVLDHLYGQSSVDNDEATPGKLVRFADIADSDEYVTPVNYRRLEAKLAADQRLATIRPTPAFAVVGGFAYPGPPVLGDARALSGFMLQPSRCEVEDPELVGWAVFDGSTAANAEQFEVRIDLGSGAQVVKFRVPAVE